MRKRWWLIVLILILLVGGVVVCTVRWQAWFGNPPEPQWEGDTIAYRFHTFADDSVPGFVYRDSAWQDLHSPDTLQILLLGDVHNSMTTAEWDTLAARYPDLDCYAQLGDFVERGYFYWFQQLFSELQGTRFDSLPILTTPGNHEYHKGVRRTLTPLWYETFPQPLNGPADFLGTTYYVDFQALRFIVIDSNGLQSLGDYTRVNTWVNRVISEAGDRFVVVMMHHPVFSCGAGRQTPMVYLTFRLPLAKADLVFAGHDHNYSRRLPFVNTNAATKYYLNKVSPRDQRICSGHRLYEVLTLVGDTLTMSTYLFESGMLYDQVRIVRDGKNRTVEDLFRDQPEIIDLPERYAGKNNAKVRRFLNRRAARQQ